MGPIKALTLSRIAVRASLVLLGVIGCLGVALALVRVITWTTAFSLLATIIGIAGYGLAELSLEKHRVQLSPSKYGVGATVRSLALLAGAGLAWTLGAESGLEYAGCLGLSLAVCSVLLARDFIAPKVGSTIREGLLQLRPYAGYGLPLAGTLLASGLVNYSDRIMLAWISGSAEAGLYSVGYDVARQSVGALAMAVNLSTLPQLISSHASGDAAFRSQINFNLAVLATAILPVTIALAFLGESVASLVVAAEYSLEVSRVLPGIALAASLEFLKIYFLDHAFHVSSRTRVLLWIQVALVAINVLLNFALIPTFGLVGALWASIVSNALGVTASAVLGRRILLFKIDPRWLAAISFAAACSGGAGVLFGDLQAEWPPLAAVTIGGGAVLAAFMTSLLLARQVLIVRRGAML